MSLLNRKFSWYDGNIYNPISRGTLDLKTFIKKHKEPSKRTVDLLDQISKAASEGDLKLKNELKEQLFYFTPSVIIKHDHARRYNNIQNFTGFAQLDFDKLSNIQEAMDFKQYVFDTYPFIATAYLSPSKLGVKCIAVIETSQDVEEYKDYYKALETEMEQYNGFDHAPKNCVLPLYISVDRDILWREPGLMWDIKEDRTVEYVSLNQYESERGQQMSFDQKSLQTIALFKEKIEAITSEPGHPRLRDACLVLGSRAGAGYIDVQQAIELAEHMVKMNGYLQKGLTNYLRTAHWAINQGYTNPAYY